MTNTPNPTDETITELARWLFTIEYIPPVGQRIKLTPRSSWDFFLWPEFLNEIKTAAGLEAVENAMIERGWSWESAYEDRQYRFSFLKDGFESVFWAKTKAAAALPAAYWAMKKEL